VPVVHNRLPVAPVPTIHCATCFKDLMSVLDSQRT
jgi:hypothetical protein